ncbi:hypothetical protein [Enterococcus termitis]|uniref:Uncharacterized protein n=1 Tax=Enterococcus termitis TaxID=332950 RepID=A0A1E5H185_9ENTE|nr:hypothetical protein [Enterococcus termitis]OEG18666.1 hypothetical protein BCR25_15810 [Enterococcus termitis]OJG97611.1 hypothetical protein RV18_GL000679 [Enterococcus termitis]
MSEFVYADNWKAIEGTSLAKAKIREKLVDSLEKEHLLEISRMLRNEGFMPKDFILSEYPIAGVYVCQALDNSNYFTVAYDSNKKELTPTYTTLKCDENRNNTFACQTIAESIKKTEC